MKKLLLPLFFIGCALSGAITAEAQSNYEPYSFPTLAGNGPGGVMVSGSQDYAELGNIYMRREGDTQWLLLGVKCKRFPFEDQTPLKQAGTPEKREYMARRVVN